MLLMGLPVVRLATVPLISAAIAVAVVDVRVQGGYTPALTAALTQNRRG